MPSIADIPYDSPVDSCEMCLKAAEQGIGEEVEIQAATTYRDEMSVCALCAEMYDMNCGRRDERDARAYGSRATLGNARSPKGSRSTAGSEDLRSHHGWRGRWVGRRLELFAAIAGPSWSVAAGHRRALCELTNGQSRPSV